MSKFFEIYFEKITVTMFEQNQLKKTLNRLFFKTTMKLLFLSERNAVAEDPTALKILHYLCRRLVEYKAIVPIKLKCHIDTALNANKNAVKLSYIAVAKMSYFIFKLYASRDTPYRWQIFNSFGLHLTCFERSLVGNVRILSFIYIYFLD